MAYRSTTLQMVARNCAHALTLYESGTPYNREHFQAGVAAHAILQAIAERPAENRQAVAEATVRDLVTRGRAFDGAAEPPMSVDAAAAGRDIALHWLGPLGGTIPFNVTAEGGYGCTEDWKPAPYRTAWLRAAIDYDYMAEEGDGEEWAVEVAVVGDYKTAWSTGPGALDTIQSKIQGVLAAIHHPEAGGVRREMVNLRTGQTYSRTTFFDDDGLEEIGRWKRDILHAIAATTNRTPRPGAGCHGCLYLQRCEHASIRPDGLAEELAVLEARRAHLIAVLKEQVAESGRVDVPGGYVGWREDTKRKASSSAVADIAHRWFEVPPERAAEWDAEHGAILGLLAAIKPSMEGIASLAAKIIPARRGDYTYKDERNALVEAWTTGVTGAAFGVHRTSTTEEEP